MQINTIQMDINLYLSGGAKGSRTPDLLNAIQALSQLSYGPTQDAVLGRSRPNFNEL
jgi:hypothetical protein